ncbi:dynactin p62 family-domain-containing protein [Irpex rosettiformis]|uniref:Dynactin p62 family-domain-containing protein n=1 Tax=Irpex rosettiformis TaxID=378272 RepID=A0ACB8TY71_9APHY|nr:dynactin p62 family-domain-containing protein [Irpex rosettiformis]
MPPSIEFYCPCLASTPHPPPPHLASSSYSFHPLHNLFFCEECDAIRCNRCVMVEVSGYYCPNCLFEVPSASVRAEKNRCARNCFMCPNCRNTLTVVPSDPPDTGAAIVNTVGEPPFFLYCNHCRWDSAEVGITFEKPTGLAAQLQKYEDSAPESLEFERLKEHYEPHLRASPSTGPAAPHSHHTHTNPITAAASSALARDIPGVGKYTPHSSSVGRNRSSRNKGNYNEVPDYRARVEIGSSNFTMGGGGETDVDLMKHLEDMSEIATLEQRWENSWMTSLQTGDLKPLRIPLHSKKSKRCPSCRHILIKPEQKAQSVRYKIKLVAANYLPAITVSLPHLYAVLAAMRKPGKTPQLSDIESTMHAGKTYSFQLSFTNPLYDPIQVRLHVQRSLPSSSMAEDGGGPSEKRRPPFSVTLPSSAFPIAAYAEAWEYEDDEEMFGVEEDDFDGGGGGRGGGREQGRGRTKTIGILERRANVTVIGGEVAISKEARGNIKFNMLVSYTYRSDDSEPSEEQSTPSRAQVQNREPEMKTFSFYTAIDLGTIIPREEHKSDAMEY